MRTATLTNRHLFQEKRVAVFRTVTHTRRAACAVLALAALAAYANAFGNQFVFDDETLIQGNVFLREGTSLFSAFASSLGGGERASDFYRPLQVLLYVLVARLGGVEPFGYHLLNVALHAANISLVYLLGRKLGFRAGAVFGAALVWGLHPIQTEAVTYMSATADTLYAFFCLLGVFILLPDFAPRRVAAAGLCMIGGLLSKEVAAVFPLLAMACLCLTSPRRFEARTYLCTWPFWLLAAGYAALRLTVLNLHALDPGFASNPVFQLYADHYAYRIYTFLATLPFYLALLVYPAGLHLERQFPVYTGPLYGEVWAGAFIILAAAAQLMWGRCRRGLALSWGLLWFAAAYSLYTGLAVPLNALFLEHWMYLPTAGLALGLAQSLAELVGRHSGRFPALNAVCAGGVVLVAVLCGAATWGQNRVWRDAFTLYPSILAQEPSPRALVNLGKAWLDRGDIDKAIYYSRAAITLRDVLPEAHQNLATALSRKPGWDRHPEPVIAELNRALELAPRFLPAINGLAAVYGVLGDKDKEGVYRRRAAKFQTTLFGPCGGVRDCF